MSIQKGEIEVLDWIVENAHSVKRRDDTEQDVSEGVTYECLSLLHKAAEFGQVRRMSTVISIVIVYLSSDSSWMLNHIYHSCDLPLIDDLHMCATVSNILLNLRSDHWRIRECVRGCTWVLVNDLA